jgi:hypothetical protein
MTFEAKREQIKQQRIKLRNGLLNKMRTDPTMKDSETLRLVEDDISFWEKQTDCSIKGMICTLQDSMSRV